LPYRNPRGGGRDRARGAKVVRAQVRASLMSGWNVTMAGAKGSARPVARTCGL